MSNFYREFEDRHRGSTAEIKRRLEFYLPFISALAHNADLRRALDVGCGRGEWLEVLGEAGFNAEGVDLDEGMLAEARSRGLNVRTANALDCLREFGPNSLGVISAMHVVEHMPPEIYKELVLEAFTALAPGGLLILETPNPENLNVGANTFYLDPTHLRPVTHQYLQFLAEFAGFDRIKIVRLHEDPALVRNERPVTLMDVLAGVSNDFALIAQKAGPAEVRDASETAFSRDYGLTLNDLAARYEEQRTNEISRLERSARQTISGQIKAAVRRLSPRRRKRDA